MINNELNSERKDFLGRGWAMPVEIDARTGRVSTVSFEDDIKQSIRIILETSPGERVMRPSFGCGIHDLVFSSLDSTTIQRIKSTVEDALRRWEARINVLDVVVNRDAMIHGQLILELEYIVRRTNQTDNFVFPFYFGEGGTP